MMRLGGAPSKMINNIAIIFVLLTISSITIPHISARVITNNEEPCARNDEDGVLLVKMFIGKIMPKMWSEGMHEMFETEEIDENGEGDGDGGAYLNLSKLNDENALMKIGAEFNKLGRNHRHHGPILKKPNEMEYLKAILKALGKCGGGKDGVKVVVKGDNVLVKVTDPQMAAEIKEFNDTCKCRRRRKLGLMKHQVIDGVPILVDAEPMDAGGTADVYHAFYKKQPNSGNISSKLPLPRQSQCMVLKEAKMGDVEEIEDNQKLFKNEADVLGHFAVENGISAEMPVIRLFASSTENIKQPKLLMEMGEKSLEKHWEGIAEKTPFVTEEFLKKMVKILDAYHRVGIHMDLKLDNFMEMERGDPRLIDFGASLLLKLPTLVRYLVNADYSDIAFRAPEHFIIANSLGHMFTTRTDIWALGVVLYKMIFGHKENPLFDEKDAQYILKKLFDGKTPNRAKEEYGKLEKFINDKIEKALMKKKESHKYEPLIKIVKLCLNVDPDKRPSAENLLSFIEGKCRMMVAESGKMVTFRDKWEHEVKAECTPTRVTPLPKVLSFGRNRGSFRAAQQPPSP